VLLQINSQNQQQAAAQRDNALAVEGMKAQGALAAAKYTYPGAADESALKLLGQAGQLQLQGGSTGAGAAATNAHLALQQAKELGMTLVDLADIKNTTGFDFLSMQPQQQQAAISTFVNNKAQTEARNLRSYVIAANARNDRLDRTRMIQRYAPGTANGPFPRPIGEPRESYLKMYSHPDAQGNMKAGANWSGAPINEAAGEVDDTARYNRIHGVQRIKVPEDPAETPWMTPTQQAELPESRQHSHQDTGDSKF
jgi:hypothetical protein